MQTREYLRWAGQYMKRRCRLKAVRIKQHDVECSLLEGILTRGDRRVAPALEGAWRRGARLDGWRDGGLAELRAAFAPFDSVGPVYAQPAQNARIPSRLHSIEELPVALGLLVAAGGDYSETMLGGVNYGRDSDSIASMGGALAGALGSELRADLVEQVSAASRIDVEEAGREMAVVAAEIFAKDAARFEARARAMAGLVPA
jgi:hypothetical protein